MPAEPFIVDRFGGLDVYNDPQEVGAASATDMLNVDIDVRGRVRNRDGSTALTSAAASAHLLGMNYSNAGGAEHIVAWVFNVITPYSLSTGTAAATQAGAPDSNNSFARFGNSSNSRLYVAANVATTIYRWSGTAWASVTVPNTPNLAAVTPNDNRLALASNTASTVYFSAVNDPETYDSTDFVNLWAGDGEGIMALTRWRDKLFAFKQTKFAVFTGTSVDSDGGAIFNYYGVDAGRGVSAIGAAVASEEGVYFADATGIYLTTGDTPRYISRALEPYLRTGAYGSLPAISTASGVILVYHDRRLYVTYPTSPYPTLVYDPALDAWLVWKLGAGSMASVPQSSAFRGVYFGETASKKIAKVDSTVATDQSVAVSWSYTSGAYDISGKNLVAITRESALWGTGTATLQVANNHGSVDTGSALTLGASPAIAQTWQQIDREGTYWQHKLSGSVAATVNRLAHYVSFVKPPGIE